MGCAKEFYFVRHGQTDYNILEGTDKGDHPEDISLNSCGMEQASKIEPIIAKLPISSIYASPLKRVQQTREIITVNVQVPYYEVMELSECNAEIWKEMRSLGIYSRLPESGKARAFMDRVQKGIDHALSNPAPTLIVAHGGIHWATCCLLGIENHNWAVHNCAVVHFSMDDLGKWSASLLTST